MNRLKRLTGKKMLLTAMALCAFGFAKAQTEQTTQNTLTLTLDKALEIALDENPTIKVAAEEIALKKDIVFSESLSLRAFIIAYTFGYFFISSKKRLLV